jgi:RimJ/RimL family protein N-acetyltransferase
MEPETPFLQGKYITLQPIEPQHIGPLFTGLGLPENNPILDYIQGFPYIHSPSDLHAHIFPYLEKHPSLTIFALLSHPYHLGPPHPSPPQLQRTAVLGLIGYRLSPSTHSIALDDILYSPRLQRTYAGTEAHYLLLRHLFSLSPALKVPPGIPQGYKRISVKNNTANVPSRKHTERLGYIHEGTLRKDNITRWATRRDSDVLSMLDEEWPRNQAALEGWLAEENFDAEGKQTRGLGEIRKGIVAGEGHC